MPPKSKEPAVDPAVTTETTAAMRGEEPAAVTLAIDEPAPPARPFLSEGIRQELEMFGKAGDPATGGKFEMDKETGKVTYIDRAGNVTEL